MGTTNTITLINNVPQNGIFTVSSSSNFANAYLAFDNNSNNEFTNNNAYVITSGNYSNTTPYITTTSNISGSNYYGEWIQLYYDKGFAATSFSITGIIASNNKCPNNFIIAGSIDTSNWVLLSSQVGIIDYTNFPTKTFSLYNFTSYNYYRLIVTKTNGDVNLSIADLSFKGSLNTTFANNDKFNLLLYNTNEKQFPPRVYDIAPSAETQLTGTNVSPYEIFNVRPLNCYKQTFSITNQPGLYTVYSSSIVGSGTTTYKQFMFDYITLSSSGNYGVWADSQYNNVDGVYSSSSNNGIGSSTEPSYKGDWIIVKFPYPIVLTKFIIWNILNTSGNAPKSWKCYGSTDGITWTEITEAASPVAGAAYTITSNCVNLLPSYFDIPYLYLGWTFNSLIARTATQLRILELQIFGKDDISNSYSNVWNKLGSNICTTYGNVGIGTTNPYTLFHMKGSSPILTVMGSGLGTSTTATAQLNLSTYDTLTNSGNCSLIATESNYGASFQINQKTSGAIGNSQFTSFYISPSGNVGIGTTIDVVSKLTVNNIVNNRWTYDHSLAPLTVTNPSPTSDTILNDPKPILNLCREGTGSKAYGARATFKLSRYEHLGNVDSKTRLDLTLATTTYDQENTVITFLSSGNIGIGKTNPNCKLYINTGVLNTTADSFAIRISSAGGTDTGPFFCGIGFAHEPNGWSKGAIGWIRTGGYDQGDMIFLNRNTNDNSNANSNYERMRIKSDGTVSINCNIDCGGSIAITGCNAFYNTTNIDAANISNTYLNLKYAGSGSDWCYIRQIGNTDAYKLAFDFYDDNNDGRFCIRRIQPNGASADIIKELFTVDNSTVSIRADSQAGSAILYLATPSDSTLGTGLKCAIIAEGLNDGVNRNKLHFCLEGSVITTSSATTANSKMTITYVGNIGIGNTIPTQPLWIGTPDNVSGVSDGKIVISKNTDLSTKRNFMLAYDSSYNFCLGDFGINNGANTFKPQLLIHHNAPSNCLVINTTGYIGIGTTVPNASIELYSTTQTLPRIILSGNEFYTGSTTSSSGIAFLCGVNRVNNRQLWIGDSANLGVGTTNPVIRFCTFNSGTAITIDSSATDGLTALPISIGNTTQTTINGGPIYLNGNVGIGTTNPITSNLAVEGKSYFKNNVGIGTSDTSTYPLNVGGNIFTSGIIIQNNSSQSNIFLGNVGIGTTNPQQKLDINGNINITGNINIAGNSTDTIYATNTTLNTIIPRINNTSNLEYTEIRQYPPKAYDSFTGQITKTFLNTTVYYESITINSYINGYGIGTYDIYASSNYIPELPGFSQFKRYLFDSITIDNNYSVIWKKNNYIYDSGLYETNAAYIIDGYYGDWIIVKLPNPIVLTSFKFYNRPSYEARAPGEWKCYGSIDGITFNEIPEGHNLSRLTTTSYSSGNYIKNLNSTFTTLYSYFGWCIHQLAGSDVILNFSEIQIFGKELLNPIYNYVSSNVLTSTLLPYTTSNICKNLILYDTPNVRKKFGFTAVCSTAITLPQPNDGITYYKFDINLTNYTKLQNTPGTGIPYRIFNITLFMANVYFEAFTTIPNVLEYKIFMSNPANSGGSGENAGINICALGRPQSYNLNAVLTTSISLVRTPDFNYLSVISKTNGTSFNVIIEDLLF